MATYQAINYKRRSSIAATVFAGIVLSAATGTAAYFWSLNGRVVKLETIQEIAPNRPGAEARPSPNAAAERPEEIVSIIQEQQRVEVKESAGELAWQSFTEDDLKRFISDKRLDSITESLKHTPRFLNVVLGVRHMEVGHRAELLNVANKPLRPTWSQLGRRSREGQTEAGQTEAGQNAERMIASAIVRLVRELVELPQDRFLQLYDE